MCQYSCPLSGRGGEGGREGGRVGLARHALYVASWAFSFASYRTSAVSLACFLPCRVQAQVSVRFAVPVRAKQGWRWDRVRVVPPLARLHIDERMLHRELVIGLEC